MTKPNRCNKLLIIIAGIGIGLAVWQNVELRKAEKQAMYHVAQTTLRGAYFLYTSADSINSFRKDNKWNDMQRRDSLGIWLTYTHDSLTYADITMNDFPSFVSYEDRTNMGDLSTLYSDWWMKTIDILNKRDPLTEQEIVHISMFSDILAKVEGFYVKQKSTDWRGISEAFDALNKEWKKAIAGK